MFTHANETVKLLDKETLASFNESRESVRHIFAACVPHCKPFSIIVYPVFSKSYKGYNSILKNQTEKPKKRQSAAILHKKSILQTCWKGVKVSLLFGAIGRKARQITWVKVLKNLFDSYIQWFVFHKIIIEDSAIFNSQHS